MNYWVTTDTHFGHNRLTELSGRPENFEDLILRKHGNMINKNDVLIHLGDICFYKDTYWHERFMSINKFKVWLVRGNHDKKSNHWYLTHGWDFVAKTIQMNIFGLDILFSHAPQPDTGYDINIHGHFHNNEHRAHETVTNNKHKLIMLEHHYEPQNLRRIVGK